jgi:hypothetical protein
MTVWLTQHNPRTTGHELWLQRLAFPSCTPGNGTAIWRLAWAFGKWWATAQTLGILAFGRRPFASVWAAAQQADANTESIVIAALAAR